ncbi:hypothetical protein PUATCC27989T_05198 [Phytobacter ursingii]|jgi:predicted transcriptional regulator|uniref:helix-turn-helix domain-containing protein n=2 Tax=Enterobacteriaceae TaxID=543 RepID=UPI000CD0C672|nr:helix-turn-helix domain-containing protein [Citrobacter sp.]AUU99608.1 hypothetical protein C2U51_00590 [Enterobacteriaceae bacterium ENNIH1]ELA3556240.1 helix-turn-helix transcriptional regulator [Citrobacter freundii]MDU6686596.1 helix-turn-helix domain-containing protein [Enterobacteriaceae bacterium]VTP17202.1 hypothetical protein PUATCC27989T_05198 [Phytobacter ursingii]HAT2611180.1 helix-turn-helix transcriptional regulator [Kluyvera intermedia]
MLVLSGSEIIKLAMNKTELNQHDFSILIGRSQSQVSKYLTGKSDIPSDVNIQCMNIIKNIKPDKDSHMELLIKVIQLQGDDNKALRRVLMELILAWQER